MVCDRHGERFEFGGHRGDRGAERRTHRGERLRSGYELANDRVALGQDRCVSGLGDRLLKRHRADRSEQQSSLVSPILGPSVSRRRAADLGDPEEESAAGIGDRLPRLGRGEVVVLRRTGFEKIHEGIRTRHRDQPVKRLAQIIRTSKPEKAVQRNEVNRLNRRGRIVRWARSGGVSERRNELRADRPQ